MRTQSASLFAILVGGLLASIVGGALRRSRAEGPVGRARRATPPDADDPRWGPSDGRFQVAGKPCEACNERITVASEGIACDTCRKPFHHRCLTRHVAEAHKLHDDGTPYR